MQIRTILDLNDRGTRVLPAKLRRMYGGDLRFPRADRDRPYVIANFVSTIDGVVSYQSPGQSTGAEISGRNQADRFVMGLLRASADAIVVGAGTFRDAGPRALWAPEFIYPAAKDLFRRLREKVLKKPTNPLLVIVSRSGRVNLDSAVFHTSAANALILTSRDGQLALERAGAAKIVGLKVRVLADAGPLAPRTIHAVLRRDHGVKLLLHEGGPQLFGEFLASGSIDELFLTTAPQVAGRSTVYPRPGVCGVAFSVDNAPWAKLISLKNEGDFLFARYRISAAKRSRPGSS